MLFYAEQWLTSFGQGKLKNECARRIQHKNGKIKNFAHFYFFAHFFPISRTTFSGEKSSAAKEESENIQAAFKIKEMGSFGIGPQKPIISGRNSSRKIRGPKKSFLFPSIFDPIRNRVNSSPLCYAQACMKTRKVKN